MSALLLGLAAYAQTSPNLQSFWPVGGAQGFAVVPSARQLRKRAGAITFVGNYGHRPLQRSVLVDGMLERDAGGIDSLFAVHVRAAYGVLDSLELSVGMPAFQALSVGEALASYGGTPAIVATGDLALEVGWRPLGEAPIGVALLPFVTLPTGSTGVFLSYGQPTLGGRLALSATAQTLHVSTSIGYRYVPSGGYIDGFVGVDDALLYGAGVGVEMVPERLRFNVELVGSQVVGPARAAVAETPIKNALHAPLELLGDLRAGFDSGVTVVAGGGPGLSIAAGTPAWRVFAGLGWRTPPDRDSDGDGFLDRFDACVERREDRDGFEDEDGCPDPDNDRDGIPDVQDRCPLQPEDFDRFQDGDGCPDLDNDRDGIPDDRDRCPIQPEDIDGIEDADGCPDYAPMVIDTDGDGIPDDRDRCLTRPEDVDGFFDDDGCPDPDNDVDGIPDVDDRCPLEPETLNEYQDDDGCPDEALAELTDDQIVILEQVHFITGTAEIIEDSYPVLEAVLAILLEHPELVRIKIEGHTDSRGSYAYNLRLSQERADAIRDWLIENGVEPERLEAEGFGEISPIAPNDTPENMALNRRVEFHILEIR